MTPRRRCTVALTLAATLLFTFPALAVPADAGDAPVFDRLAAVWSQLWSGIDRLLPGRDVSTPALERAAGGSGALLNPDGFSSGDGDDSGALLNPDGNDSGALLNPDGNASGALLNPDGNDSGPVLDPNG